MPGESLCSNLRRWRAAVAFVGISGTSAFSLGQELADYSPEALKKLPLEQLVDVEISSASRRPEPLLTTSSAVDVVTADDIRRSGVTNIPDALRLATGLHVAQADGHTWAISARGFNSTTANKMQVLMDGRNLYTPLYSGVFWDVQHTFLPDIEQIEVIRGPGATLWGANAVNGVINIRTKSAKDTQGWLVHGGAGIEQSGFGGVRYGGRIGDTYYRAYVTGLSRDSFSQELMGLDARDEYGLVQGGFRIDSDLAPGELLTFQGDLYTGRFGQYTADDAEVSGGNFLGRWSRELGTDSSVMLQAYYDRTHRLLPGVGEEDRNSIDIEWQHRFPLARIHDIIWGLNARLSEDKIDNLGPSLAFLPDQETSYLLSGYVQDEIRVIPDLLSVTLGSKFEYNSFSGFEVQPSGRFAFTPTKTQTIWGAVSRAVRTPSRIDQDLFVPNPAFFPASILRSSRAFDSEELIAYELGYRAQPASNLKFDLALFYHDYDNLRSQEPIGAAPFPVVFANNLEGQSYGAELEVGWQPASWWRMSLGYTLMQTHFRAVDGSRDTTGGRGHGNDPNHIVVARSSFDLPGDFELDTIFRYVDRLPAPQTPAYTTVDVRLAWVARDDLELALVGRNLLDDTHPEWRSGVTREIGRSLYFTVTWRF